MSPGTRTEYAGVEWTVNARESAWLCRMGRQAVDGPFEKFVDKVTKAALEYSENKVDYREPAGPRATFGWDDDFVVDGKRIPLRYQRFDTSISAAIESLSATTARDSSFPALWRTKTNIPPARAKL